MPTRINGDRVPIQLWANLSEVEGDAIKQLKAVAALPWVAHHVAVMPDVHVGKGATVGSVIAMRGAVAPAAVGVDIGCGMMAVRTSLSANRLPDSLKALRLDIEATVPVGHRQHALPVWQESPALSARCGGGPHTLHRARGRGAALRRIWPYSWPARRRSMPTGARCTGPRTTRRSIVSS